MQLRKKIYSGLYSLAALTAMMPFSVMAYDKTIEMDEEIFYIPQEEPYPWFRPFVTLTGGAVGIRMNTQDAFFIWDETAYLFNVDDTTRAETEFGGFVGNAFPYFNDDWGIENSDWEIQLGLSYYQLSSVRVAGTLSQGTDTITRLDWQQFDYRYKIISRQALVEAKLVASWYDVLHPYIEAGIGASFNNAYHYSVTFISTNPVNEVFVTPVYKDNTNTAFSYRAGLGIDIDIIDHVRLGVGYRFVDWGKADLGSGYIGSAVINNTLEQPHLYSNGGEVQLTLIM